MIREIKMSTQCISIKSKKYSSLRCPNTSSRGDFCAKHCKTKIIWVSNVKPFTKRQKEAAKKIFSFFVNHWRRKARRSRGLLLYAPAKSDNNIDIYTLDPISTIPFTYHFSYLDSSKKAWTFDLRFLLQLLQHGSDLKNPFTQDLIEDPIVKRLQQRSKILISQRIPIIYTDQGGLTPEQLWNQKVLDVFLTLNTLGYGANMIWFESMGRLQHLRFYTRLYEMWNESGMQNSEKERIVPGYTAAESPLFRWTPEIISGQNRDIKWWRKQSLALMNAFLTRGQDRTNQTSGALYILTALVYVIPKAAEAYPWLV